MGALHFAIVLMHCDVVDDNIATLVTCAGNSHADPSEASLWDGECLCVTGYISNPSTSSCVTCTTLNGVVTGSIQGSCSAVRVRFGGKYSHLHDYKLH